MCGCKPTVGSNPTATANPDLRICRCPTVVTTDYAFRLSFRLRSHDRGYGPILLKGWEPCPDPPWGFTQRGIRFCRSS